eukprot:c11824_g1_i3.p1 GENE.c11824_g1_i3~~c11824_g1_i3.p1  ORF type:complete len:706 (-),score=158.02 c11824_g1_i3:158-2275(-)
MGITAALTSQVRDRNMGLGFKGSEKTEAIRALEKEMRRMRGQPLEEDKPEEPAVPPQPLRPAAWKKDVAKVVRTTRVYKTAQQLLHPAGDSNSAADGEWGDNKPTETKPKIQTIIDMRGPGVRVLTSFKDLNEQMSAQARAESRNLPELQHNLQLLIDLAEADIQRLDTRATNDKDSMRHLLTQRTFLESQLTSEEDQISRMESVVAAVSGAMQNLPQSPSKTTDNDDPAAVLHHLHQLFVDLQRKYPAEYNTQKVYATALALCMPFFKSMMEQWQPLTQAAHGIECFKEWRPVLKRASPPQGASSGNKINVSGGGRGGDDEAHYHRLISECWLSHVRRTVLTTWNPKQPEALLMFLELWQPVVGDHAIRYALMQNILPKIVQACDDWNPRMDPVPVHQWLHPWLPMLGLDTLSPAHAIIRRKISSVLVHWHPSDASALIVLSPWKGVFPAKDFEQMLLQTVVPKLLYCVRELLIHAGNQTTLDPLKWLFSWTDVLPTTVIVAILETDFFPKWHNVLIQWLCTGTADYTQVMQWYTAWKSLFPSGILSHDRVQVQFKQALDVMNQTLAGRGVLPGSGMLYGAAATTPTSLSALHNKPAAVVSAIGNLPKNKGDAGGTGQLTAARAKALLDDGSLSIKDITAQLAEQHGVMFMPYENKLHLGKSVYLFGERQIVFDRNQAYVKDNNVWLPQDVEDICDLAELQGMN